MNPVRLAFSVCAAGVKEDIVDGVVPSAGQVISRVLVFYSRRVRDSPLGAALSNADRTTPPGFARW